MVLMSIRVVYSHILFYQKSSPDANIPPSLPTFDRHGEVHIHSDKTSSRLRRQPHPEYPPGSPAPFHSAHSPQHPRPPTRSPARPPWYLCIEFFSFFHFQIRRPSKLWTLPWWDEGNQLEWLLGAVQKGAQERAADLAVSPVQGNGFEGH